MLSWAPATVATATFASLYAAFGAILTPTQRIRGLVSEVTPGHCAAGPEGRVCRLEEALRAGHLEASDLSAVPRSDGGRLHLSAFSIAAHGGLSDRANHELVGVVVLLVIVVSVGIAGWWCDFCRIRDRNRLSGEGKTDILSTRGRALEVDRSGPKQCEVDKASMGGAAQDGSGSFAWLRKSNDQDARSARREVASLTELAVDCRGYSFNVPLLHVDEMLAGTRLVSPTTGSWPAEREAAPRRLGWLRSTRLRVVNGALLDVAGERAAAGSGARVAVVNAASAYHVGGGFSTGGRHALEEAICTQTTAYVSLELAAMHAEQAGVTTPPWARPGRCRDMPRAHIPEDGAVLSPLVEVFRKGTDDGYKFLDSPWVIDALVSIAMPNNNDQMSDSPLDAQLEPEAYEAQLKRKWRAALTAAAHYTEANVLVLPDAGCGVFKNPPEQVGAALGQVLRAEFPRRFEEVLLVFGASSRPGEAFAKAARYHFGGR